MSDEIDRANSGEMPVVEEAPPGPKPSDVLADPPQAQPITGIHPSGPSDGRIELLDEDRTRVDAVMAVDGDPSFRLSVDGRSYEQCGFSPTTGRRQYVPVR